MILRADELAAIARQATEEYPNECCGVVLERGDERRVFACRNVQDAKHAEDPVKFSRTARTAYYMEPQDIFAWTRLEDAGFRVAVIYHSHPDAAAYFSPTDVAQATMIDGTATYPDATYVVVSVVNGRVADAAAFRWDAVSREFTRVPGFAWDGVVTESPA